MTSRLRSAKQHHRELVTEARIKSIKARPKLRMHKLMISFHAINQRSGLTFDFMRTVIYSNASWSHFVDRVWRGWSWRKCRPEDVSGTWVGVTRMINIKGAARLEINRIIIVITNCYRTVDGPGLLSTTTPQVTWYIEIPSQQPTHRCLVNSLDYSIDLTISKRKTS